MFFFKGSNGYKFLRVNTKLTTLLTTHNISSTEVRFSEQACRTELLAALERYPQEFSARTHSVRT